MNWITNYVRPTINSLFSRREVPENLWQKCSECGTMLFHRELSDNQNVCTNCGHHMHITPRDRFTALFDGGVFTEVAVPEPITDPLKFRDQKKYPDRMKAAQKKTDEKEAMLVASGEIGRTPIVAAAQDFSFMGGSMGMYVGNAIIAAAEEAVRLGRPLVLFSAAGGARMQEGILSLMQMPRTTDNAWLLCLWAMGFGLLMADLTARAGTLGPAIAVHFVNNIVALLILGSPSSLFGLALYLLPYEMSDVAALRPWLWVDCATMLVLWLVARLAIRR